LQTKIVEETHPGRRAGAARRAGAWIMLNALWTPLTFQDAALLTIAVPLSVVRLAPAYHVLAVALLQSAAGLAAMIVPPVAGWFSDALRRRGGSRRAFVAVGLAIDVVALLGLADARSLWWLAVFWIAATAGANVALAAYQALLPESVPRRHWGAVSGVRGATTLAGTVLGFAIGGWMPDPHYTFLVAAGLMALGGFSLLGIGEGVYDDGEHARVRDWHDFLVVFAARFLVFFGLILLQTYVLLFFRDILRVGDPSVSTALYGFSFIVGAIASTFALGALSDRAPRKIVTAWAGVPMALAVIGFALAPRLDFMLPFAFLFGIGFGGILSAGWALAMDTVPELRDVARDLGLWGIATNLPNVVAPLVGGWLIAFFGGTRAGYQAVFGLAGFSFALASLAVLRVGRTPLSSLWMWPVRAIAVLANYAWNHTAYRVRSWGRIPRKRGATLIVANHQHDLESMSIVATVSIQSGPWRHPIFTACSRRMYEPGFLAVRLPWLRWILRPFNAGPLFIALGLLPLEHELSAREISALAWSVQRRHGPLPLSDVFDERVAATFPPGTKTSDLWRDRFFDSAHAVVKIGSLHEPYRREILEETRASIAGDLARMEDVLRRGGTFYITPEGRYSTDGRLSPMRGAIDRLAPLATIYLAGVSYDPFVSKRLSMLFRLVRLDDREHLVQTLAAIRPVVTSQLLASWLRGRSEPFTAQDAWRAVEERLNGLPPSLFVDPELKANPRRMVVRALREMVRVGLCKRCAGDTFAAGEVRRHPQFPHVGDIVAHQANMFEETLANAAYSTPTAG
jgi:MFS family permease